MNTLKGQTIFLSASVPDDRTGDGSSAEASRAILEFAAAILGADGKILFGGHPTVCPLLLQVLQNDGDQVFRLAPDTADHPPIKLYQSEIFLKNIVANATWILFEKSLAELVITPKAEGEDVFPANFSRDNGEGALSLRLMRTRMIKDSDPAAAIFIGGKDGILEEAALFQNYHPGRPVYCVEGPGGAARQIAANRPNQWKEKIRDYKELMNRIIDEISQHAGRP
jgi:hypothetical protein